MVTFLGKFWGANLKVGLCSLYQIHQKNLGMGKIPSFLGDGNARILEAPVAAKAP